MSNKAIKTYKYVTPDIIGQMQASQVSSDPVYKTTVQPVRAKEVSDKAPEVPS